MRSSARRFEAVSIIHGTVPPRGRVSRAWRLVHAMVCVFVANACRDSSTPCVPDASCGGPPICTATGECEETASFGAATHVAGPIDYADTPPAGGPHNPCWTSYGVHTTEVADENWVHNLEHGAVVFLYACPTGCESEVAALAALVPGRPMGVVSSYSLMPEGFAAVSWGHRLVTPTLDLAAFTAFYDAHVDDAPESVSGGPPSSCVVAP